MTLARWTAPVTLAAAGLLATSGAMLFGQSPDPARPAAPEPPSAQAVAPGPIPAPPGLTLEATGRVVDAQGQPVAGATVTIREWTSWRSFIFNQDDADRLRRTETMPDILAETRTDADGRFRFAGVATKPFPGEQNETVGRTAFPFDLVALADGHGIAHEHLTAVNQHRPLTLALPVERPVRGRVVEPGGRPIAGARVRVTEVGPLGVEAPLGQHTERVLKLGWTSLPLAATTDVDGRFALRHLPAEARVVLNIRAAGHAQSYFPYATTDRPPAELADPSLRTGELTVELKPTDHRLVGRVVFEDGGRPAAGRDVFRNNDQVSKTDAAGQFAIDELTAGRFNLQVSAEGTDAAPLAMWVDMPDEPKVVDRTFELPQGVTLVGRVTDAATGRGVSGVKLNFEHRTEPGEPWSFFGLGQTTDQDGRYRFVVPAGRGKLAVGGVPPGYPPIPSHAVGEAGAAGFVQEVEAARGETATTDFAIPHGQGVVLRAVGPDGRPVAGAEVRRLAGFRSRDVVGRTDAEGRHELIGLDPAQRHTADITLPGRDLGVRVVVPSPPPPQIDAQLAPLGAASGRVLDAAGEPLAGATVRLYTRIEFPERSGLPVDDAQVDRAGAFRFDSLLDGVEYFITVQATGFADAMTQPFPVRADAPVAVPEFRLPATTQTLDGFVVDPRGARLANITVSVLEDPLSRYTPSGRRFQDTDARGEFHLDGLPAGELTLLVYPKPDGADRTIQHMVRLQARAGSKGVRLVLPDANAQP